MRHSNDEDYVPLPEHEKGSRGPAPQPKPVPPEWEPMPIPEGIPEKGRPNLPEHVDRTDPLEIFSLFWPLKIMKRLAYFANRNYRLDKEGLEKDLRDGKKEMKEITENEIAAWLGIKLYIGGEGVKDVSSVWNTNETFTAHTMVRKAMSKRRYGVISKWFCLYKKQKDEKTGDKTLHRKIEQASTWLQAQFMCYWIPGRNIAIDEAIQRFTGRAVEIVTIPTKPDPVGLKNWLMADGGYVLAWRFHIRGGLKRQGPQFKSRRYVKIGWNKTQAVVLDLIDSLPNRGKGYTIWLDNLFVSARLLSYLRYRTVPCAGTCRTTKTKREKQHEKEMGITEDREVSLTCFSCFFRRTFGHPGWLGVLFSDCFQLFNMAKKYFKLRTCGSPTG